MTLSPLNQVITDYLADPSNFPPEFKNWVTIWVETFPPATPISQIIGLASSQTNAIITTPSLIASGTTEGAITWGAIHKDASAMWASGSPTKLTCKVSGTYQCSAFLDWGTNATGVRTIWIRKNGSTHIAGSSETPLATGTPQSCSGLFDLAANDYIELTGFQNSGGNITPSGFFTAVRVSP